MKRDKFMGWTITLIVGTGLVVIAAVLGVSEHRWIRNAAIGDGEVVDLVLRQSTTHRRTGYSPRITFTAEDGSQHTFTRASASNPPGYSVGEHVKVAYDR